MFLGLAAAGEDEVLDPEEVAEDQEELVLIPVVTAFKPPPQAFGIVVLLVVVVAPEGHRQRRDGAGVVVEGDVGNRVKGGRRRDGVGEGEPEGIEVVEPEREAFAVAWRNFFERLDELFPERPILLLGLRDVIGLIPLRQNRKEVLRRERLERIAPVEGLSPVGKMDPLEERQETGGVVVLFGLRPFVGEVVSLKSFPLEAGGDPVGGGDHPLEEGFGRVVLGGGVDERIIPLPSKGLPMKVFWEKLLKLIPGEGGVSGVVVGEAATS